MEMSMVERVFYYHEAGLEERFELTFPSMRPDGKNGQILYDVIAAITLDKRS